MTEVTRVHSTPSNIEVAIANGVAFVMPAGILQQDAVIIAE
jgi:hypothetical protein